MITTWRVSAAAFADTMFSGEGARRYGGRWNSPGHRIVYTSQDQALAALETLVHLQRLDPEPFLMAPVRLPEELVHPLDPAELPDDWRAYPFPNELQAIGDRWIAVGKTPVLRVPSAVIADSFNYLINLEHPDSDRIEFGKGEPFWFDPRLFKSRN